MLNVALLFLTQLIYSFSDLGKKVVMGKAGFGAHLLTNGKFLVLVAIPVVGFVLQMYVLSRYDLSRSITILGVLAVVISSLLGVLVLKEHLSPLNYTGILFALVAIVLVQMK